MILGKWIELPKIADPRGNLSFIESNKHVPFEIKRVYYLYDVPGGVARGGHAHKNLTQVAIALSGSFDFILDNGVEKERYTLNSPYKGLLISNNTWREMENFSSGSVCLVLASNFYSEDDYIRSYDSFLKSLKKD
jgi:WxcM-like, C-terminal